MSKGLAFIAFFLTLVLVILSIIYLFLKANAPCSVSIISNSKLLRVKIEDRQKFKEFVSKYVTCQEGYFLAGDPVTKEASKVRRVKYIITDEEQIFKVTTGKSRDNLRDVAKLLYSYGFELNTKSREALIYFNPTAEFIGSPQFTNQLIFTLAALSDYLNNYNNPDKLLLRIGKLEDFNFDTEKIGVSYEKLF